MVAANWPEAAFTCLDNKCLRAANRAPVDLAALQLEPPSQARFVRTCFLHARHQLVAAVGLERADAPLGKHYGRAAFLAAIGRPDVEMPPALPLLASPLARCVVFVLQSLSFQPPCASLTNLGSRSTPRISPSLPFAQMASENALVPSGSSEESRIKSGTGSAECAFIRHGVE